MTHLDDRRHMYASVVLSPLSLWLVGIPVSEYFYDYPFPWIAFLGLVLMAGVFLVTKRHPSYFAASVLPLVFWFAVAVVCLIGHANTFTPVVWIMWGASAFILKEVFFWSLTEFQEYRERPKPRIKRIVVQRAALEFRQQH